MYKNWVPTVAGLMAAVGGFPVALMQSGYHLNPTFSLVMAIIGLFGIALLGRAAKGQDQHSTQAQVTASTAVVVATTPRETQAAVVLAKTADEQVAAKK
jgi:hypothetical protein